MERRTKIVCTIGPASADIEIVRRLIDAGMDVARLNFSHGTHDEHARVVENVRRASEDVGKPVAILQDLQGPKIRVGQMLNGGVLIHKGMRLVLTNEPIEFGDRERVYISYPTLSEDVDVGGTILLDDGTLELEIKEVLDGEVVTEVVVGGPLRSRKGVNLPHIRSNTPSLTEKDVADLEFGLSLNVDIIALSFVRQQADVANLIGRVRESGRRVKVVAKIEKPEAIREFDHILIEADGIMVARGDLGIEMPIAQVPRAQKTIIHKCLRAAKPVITATQMLESMIENPRPTRAEASDVANAVLDGTDAVMLSGETAAGKHPVRVVEVMDQIVREAERFQREYESKYEIRPDRITEAEEVTESVSLTAYQLAEQTNARVIACLTATGTTARAIARHRPSMPIYAFTDDEKVVRQLALLWGTKGFAIPFQRDTDEGVNTVHKLLKERGLVAPGDLIVITAGMPLPSKGRTNMVHVSRV
jgi:pyruvate kinase